MQCLHHNVQSQEAARKITFFASGSVGASFALISLIFCCSVLDFFLSPNLRLFVLFFSHMCLHFFKIHLCPLVL